MGKANDQKRFLTNLQKILFCLFAFRIRLRFRLSCRRCNFCRLVADIPVFIQFVQKCFMSTIHFWLQIKGTTTFGIVCSEVLVELLHTQQIHLQLLQKEKSDSHPLSSNSEFVIAITDDKDTGTIWEAGCAFSRDIPVILNIVWKKIIQKNWMLIIIFEYDSQKKIEKRQFFF